MEYDIFWWGVQESHLSDVGLDDIKNDQKKGYGIRGALKIKKENDKWDFIIEPFVRYWNIAESERSNVTFSGTVIGQAFEPKNNSLEYGIKLAVNF